VDDAVVTTEDVGSNFFVDEESEGQSRAKVVTRRLREMNGDVKGTALSTPMWRSWWPSNSPSSTPSISSSPSHCLGPLSFAFSCTSSQPTFRWWLCATSGLIGLARLQVREHLIVESQIPTNDRFDLYIHPQQLALWPELQHYIDSFILADRPEGLRIDPPDDLTPCQWMEAQSSPQLRWGPQWRLRRLSSLSSPYLNGVGLDSGGARSHPLCVILGHLMRRWLSSHSSVPSTYEEKAAFKRSIIAASWDYANETNFAEAVEFAHRAYDRPSLDSLTAAVLCGPQDGGQQRQRPLLVDSRSH